MYTCEAIRWLVGVVETGNLSLNGAGETSDRRLALHADIKNKRASLRSVNRKVSGKEQLRIGGLELLMHKQVSENCQYAGKENTEKNIRLDVKDKWEEM
jgi:hypothetical protein